MMQFVSSQDSAQELQFPTMLKVMTEGETKEYHLQKFAQWSKKWELEQKGDLVYSVDRNVYRNGNHLDEEPRDEDKEWVLFRLSHPVTWPKLHNKIGDSKNWESSAHKE